ncbi:glycosyltransferase family 2 protein [Neobacillus terrae]|uniref:glycosyltransferase family 2 protein n=1 Tax=Neobacillus terrae TaxID=3034837 RepID=UPI00140ACCF5|nr:glycosyltransferase [Neobacillus terrae]NHM31125.1 glycosyltransferase [Neobacillus terrae]
MGISVVTAVYNGEEYLKESIESILKQTYSHFEYIIVNDGSNDKTREILDNIADSRVKAIHLERNGGAANALNIGINEARGKWIALQDADDVSIEHRLQTQLYFIKSDPRLVVVGSLVQCIPGNDKINQKFLQWEESFFNNKKNFRKEQFNSTPLCNGTGFFLKSAFEKIGGYDPIFKIAYDYDLWTRMFEMGGISRVPEVLYKYRVRKNSLAHRDKIDTRNEVLLSTFKNISELRFNHLNRKPKLLLLGTEKNYEFYRSHLEGKNHFITMSFPDPRSNDIEEAYSLYKSNEIDGIVVNSKKRRLLRQLRRRGLSFGKNLFTIQIP